MKYYCKPSLLMNYFSQLNFCKFIMIQSNNQELISIILGFYKSILINFETMQPKNFHYRIIVCLTREISCCILHFLSSLLANTNKHFGSWAFYPIKSNLAQWFQNLPHTLLQLLLFINIPKWCLKRFYRSIIRIPFTSSDSI